MILLHNIGGDIHHAVAVLVGEGHSGIAQVVFEGVFLLPVGAVAGIYIGIEITPLAMINCFDAGVAGAGFAVLDAAGQVVVLVLGGGAYFDCFVRFVAGGIVFVLDAVAA